uniref:Uncharacterized protein n=1 Tax=Setaria italica TaxID=4555 RepID=K3XN90_SETIT
MVACGAGRPWWVMRPAMPTDAAEGEDAARAEEAGHADAAQLAPPLAGRHVDHVAGAVVEAVGHEQPGPAREDEVAGLHGLLGCGRRGRHDGGHLAEAQEHDRTARRGHRSERPLRACGRWR